MCLAAALLLCTTWWFTRQRYSTSKLANTRNRRLSLQHSYLEASASVEQDLKQLENSETDATQAMVELQALKTASAEAQKNRLDAIQSQLLNWASLLKGAREDLSRLQGSTSSQMKKVGAGTQSC